MTEQKGRKTKLEVGIVIFCILALIGLLMGVLFGIVLPMIRTTDQVDCDPFVWYVQPDDPCYIPIPAPTKCPSPPRYKTEFAISSYYEGTGSINFDATEDIAAAAEAFGWLYEGDGGYTLYVDSRYDFQEVLAYLESWGECHFILEESTPTPEPGGVRILDGPVLYSGVVDGRCYVDALTLELIYTGREVSCDDWETPVEPTPTPTPDPYFAYFIGLIDLVEFSDLLETAVPPATPTPTPTAIPNLIVQSYDHLDPLDKLLQDLMIIALATEYTFAPKTIDVKLFIDWPHTIHITDAFSQTTVISGPATVRFEEGE